MRIVFMGTPEYSVNTLESLIRDGHRVEAVFAQPDKPVGRKHIVTAPPVKVCAISHGIKVYQPSTLKNGEAESIIKSINPDVIVVVAYGKILPSEILCIPKFGCINGHASLLPKYRGASPIQWCIVCGEKTTGVTTMLMDKGMDTGNILDSVIVKIDEQETADELFLRLSKVTADLMVQTLKKLENNQIEPLKQNEEMATYAPIITKEMAKIDFKNKTGIEIKNAVRGFYSWPCAYFILDGQRVKIIKAEVGIDTAYEPATVIDNKNELIISCKGGTSIKLLIVQPEGSKQMTAKQMLCGHAVPNGKRIEE